jgi:acyl-CoA reductase-like NAD-dependent aldehyde dehydrogenase
MTAHQLHEMLGDLDDTRELVLEAPHADAADEDPLVLAWRSAAGRAREAYAAWRSRGGADAYAVYRALADQADAAQDALAAMAARRVPSR